MSPPPPRSPAPAPATPGPSHRRSSPDLSRTSSPWWRETSARESLFCSDEPGILFLTIILIDIISPSTNSPSWTFAMRQDFWWSRSLWRWGTLASISCRRELRGSLQQQCSLGSRRIVWSHHLMPGSWPLNSRSPRHSEIQTKCRSHGSIFLPAELWARLWETMFQSWGDQRRSPPVQMMFSESPGSWYHQMLTWSTEEQSSRSEIIWQLILMLAW